MAGSTYMNDVGLEQPHRNVTWAGPTDNRASRKRFHCITHTEGTRIMPAHLREMIAPEQLQKPPHEVGQP